MHTKYLRKSISKRKQLNRKEPRCAVKKRSGMHLSKVSLVRNQLSVDPMQEAQTPPGNSSSRLGARQLPCLTSATTRQNGERAQQPLRRRQALSQYRPGEDWRLWYVLALQLMIPSQCRQQRLVAICPSAIYGCRHYAMRHHCLSSPLPTIPYNCSPHSLV
jgi:hypothetical protein